MTRRIQLRTNIGYAGSLPRRGARQGEVVRRGCGVKPPLLIGCQPIEDMLAHHDMRVVFVIVEDSDETSALKLTYQFKCLLAGSIGNGDDFIHGTHLYQNRHPCHNSFSLMMDSSPPMEIFRAINSKT